MSRKAQPAWDRMQDRLKVDPEAGCWSWTGSTTPTGYGQVWDEGRARLVHRVSYEHHRGRIADGMQLDHLCRNRQCVNPDHLEPVTCRENLLRGETVAARHAGRTQCPAGHEYDEANTYHRAGRRYCRTCQRNRSAARRAA